MKKSNKSIGVFITLIFLIISIHIVLLGKHLDNNDHFYNTEVDPVHYSLNTFSPILLVPIRPVCGAT